MAKNPDRDPFDRYFTAESLAQRMVKWARIEPGMQVLEPSAGDGSLIWAMRGLGVEVTAVDLLEEQAVRLRQRARDWVGLIHIHQADFLQWRPAPSFGRFDLALMNPPFSAGADGKHVMHALRFSERVVALVRTNFEHTQRRWHDCMVRARVTRKAVLVPRPPPFTGPGDLNQSPQSDYVVLELVRRETPRLEGETDSVAVEYWT